MVLAAAGGIPTIETSRPLTCSEEGTTTIPVRLLVANRASRYHLAMETLRRGCRLLDRRQGADRGLQGRPGRHRCDILEHGVDPPEIADWTWPEARPHNHVPSSRPGRPHTAAARR